jgi:hypothetical protein
MTLSVPCLLTPIDSCRVAQYKSGFLTGNLILTSSFGLRAIRTNRTNAPNATQTVMITGVLIALTMSISAKHVLSSVTTSFRSIAFV